MTVKLRSNLKGLADEKGISIRKLAEEIDYNFEGVRRMYNDEMDRYPRELLEKLCNYFGVGIDELLVREKGMN